MEPGGKYIDKYHHLIPLCLLGLNVFEIMQCQNNTDKQIMMNEGKKCLSLGHPIFRQNFFRRKL